MALFINSIGLGLLIASFSLDAATVKAGEGVKEIKKVDKKSKEIKEIAVAQISEDQNVGCGAGRYVMKDPTIFSLTMRATTNQSFSTQLFGITSGTCGCRKHDIVQNREDRRQIFWALHQEDILVEISEYRRDQPYLKTYLELGGKI